MTALSEGGFGADGRGVARDQGRQLARHLAAGKNFALSPVNRKIPSFPDGNDGALTGTTATVAPLDTETLSRSTSPPRPHHSVGPVRRLDRVAGELSPGDWTILRSVEAHRFLTARQLHQLHGDGQRHPRRTQAQLARLRRLRVLGTLERRVGGIRAGSHGLVYYVDEVGDRLLRRDSGRTTRRRPQQRSPRFVSHQLAIADVHAELVLADRQRHLSLLHVELEPDCWRRYQGIGGVVITLKPDLYVETAPPGGSDDDSYTMWFIERDLGTEHLPTQLTKCRAYEHYRAQGIEQEQTGGGFPLVVWSLSHPDPATAERRRIALRGAIDRDSRLDPALFQVISPSQLLPFIQQHTTTTTIAPTPPTTATGGTDTDQTNQAIERSAL